YSLRRPPTSPLFPYTTLFRSDRHLVIAEVVGLDAVFDLEAEDVVVDALRGGEFRSIDGQQFGERLLALLLAPRQIGWRGRAEARSEEHTSELQSRGHLVCRLL